ncbi:MAG: AAA family ATPase, partial [Syntrophomonadaceae bacterium]|nr:AAA family ATPase [Syntrophomonadaceae bacterium]
MYLRRLELRGFKSFAEPTKIYFNSGINVVVGPNGCGKSNIIDAIRWVLGESNIRHLRGQRNEDVIFTGTDEKRPLGLAQVEITIDNQDKILPVDYSEVTVSRKVFRSGDSEFFINKAPVRLKDIQALFAGTGLGRKGYSIIGQGELEQVLNARAFERRLILEEAAGIIQFRQKIEEASARLQLTEQDLVRVNDILQELNQRREELAVKAEKAETWRRLQGQLDRLEQIVMASTIAVLRRELTSRSQALSSARVDDDLLRDEVRNREQELAQLTEQLDNLKNELAVSKDDKYQKGTEIGRLSGELKLAQERVRSASERLVNLAEDESK